jgi:hypothetical protein
MDKAAPQAAERMTAADIEQALAALDMVWGDEYTFGYDPEKGFWAARPGKIGPLFIAGTPEELGKVLTDGAGTGPS